MPSEGWRREGAKQCLNEQFHPFNKAQRNRAEGAGSLTRTALPGDRLRVKLSLQNYSLLCMCDVYMCVRANLENRLVHSLLYLISLLVFFGGELLRIDSQQQQKALASQ